jgi:hypothetical protein
MEHHKPKLPVRPLEDTCIILGVWQIPLRAFLNDAQAEQVTIKRRSAPHRGQTERLGLMVELRPRDPSVGAHCVVVGCTWTLFMRARSIISFSSHTANPGRP